MSIVVPIIVCIIILMQIYFFVKNVSRMREYSKIFENKSSWGIEHNPSTQFVSGIVGDGNTIFDSIKGSINQYLGNNSGSVIDFHLLKDAVDRHSDAVENDIITLTPVPLYCGLAGTMAGVIIGLTSLLATGSITSLLTSGDGGYYNAANGVNDLLEGVAYAMLASICGIFFTTASSILFKRYRLEAETGKNTFLAWLQAKLLPELPSDTSEALNGLVDNLNKFNQVFSHNTLQLRGALDNVNASYRIQADIIKAVHDMDVMKMAQANVKVLQELNECTEKLERFNQYLNDVEGYTDSINDFTSKLAMEANKWSVLEEIRDFFNRHKAEIAKDLADSDVALNTALESLRESTGEGASELHAILVRQAEEFKGILEQQRDSFEKVNDDIVAKFSTQLNQFPELEEHLSAVSDIPDKIDALIDKLVNSNADMVRRLEISNSDLYKNIVFSLKEGFRKEMINREDTDIPKDSVNDGSPRHKWLEIVCVVLIAIACITNTVYNIFFDKAVAVDQKESVVMEQYVDSVNEVEIISGNDSAKLSNKSDIETE